MNMKLRGTMETLQKIQEIQFKATCLYDKQAVEQAIAQMAKQIQQRLQNENPILLCVMVGGLVLTGQLLTLLNFPLELDYIHVTRYGGATRGGDLHWKVEPRLNLRDRHILIIDDILDGGLTLGGIVDYCRLAGAKQVSTAVLVDKRRKREKGGTEEADYVGLTVDNHFLFGYGLDYDEYLRNAPGVYRVASEHE
jgi:hypoxanthine phosphoribosyltransferase